MKPFIEQTLTYLITAFCSGSLSWIIFVKSKKKTIELNNEERIITIYRTFIADLEKRVVDLEKKICLETECTNRKK